MLEHTHTHTHPCLLCMDDHFVSNGIIFHSYLCRKEVGLSLAIEGLLSVENYNPLIASM